MTPDKDFAQLVSENIFMYRPGRGGKPAEIWGIHEVQQKFEVEFPHQVIDILGMWGDSSDNIPGVSGIGPKTLLKHVPNLNKEQEYELETLWETCNDKIDDSKTYKKILVILIIVIISF